MGKQTIELEIPDFPMPAAPDLAVHPIISELRERTARLEERTSGALTDPAAAEALRLAGEARRLADDVKNRLDQMALNVPRTPVVEIHPPAALRVPEPDPQLEVPTGSESPTHLPIWHPHRWF